MPSRICWLHNHIFTVSYLQREKGRGPRTEPCGGQNLVVFMCPIWVDAVDTVTEFQQFWKIYVLPIIQKDILNNMIIDIGVVLDSVYNELKFKIFEIEFDNENCLMAWRRSIIPNYKYWAQLSAWHAVIIYWNYLRDAFIEWTAITSK